MIIAKRSEAEDRTLVIPRSLNRPLLVIASNGMLRVAGGASSVLVGVYIADLAIAD